ncbi:type II secretion system major pseudopilin GspG [Sphingomonas profundi]|uniref:type II secretion system major pseudopilin GspG n=1 Tax=Alterirhizorhabdus profundi TaxID=2681549 RepID=UPI002410D0A5|nr:type II secretion system major pseudopilin GspG [Sphingomonas profundi]
MTMTKRRTETSRAPARRSAECGFRPVARSAEHGFTSFVRSAEHGFTLVELMVVIVIIGLLTTIVVINVLPSQDKARVEKAKTDIALLEQAAEMYRLDNLSYPGGGDGLKALVSAPAGVDTGRYRPGGYIRKLPDDPWGNPYHYVSPGKHGAVDIFSYGADGREGGEGNDADIGNWK